MAETVLRQFHVSALYTGQLTIAQVERRFGVDIRPLALAEARDFKDRPLRAGSLISVEGEHDNVYRLFNVLCPGVLRPEQVAALNARQPSAAPQPPRDSPAMAPARLMAAAGQVAASHRRR